MEPNNRFRSALEQIIHVQFLYSHLLIPVGVLAVYCLSLMFFLPEGVNQVFVSRSAKLFLVLAGLLLIIFLAVIGIKKIKPQLVGFETEKLQPEDLILSLLPLTPVVQYIINNSNILTWLDIVIIISLILLFVSLPIFIIPLLFSKTGATYPLMFLGVAFTFLITNMASMTGRFKWYGEGNLKIQLAVLGSVWIIGWILHKFNLRSFLYLFIAVNFIVNSMLQFKNRDGALSAAKQDFSDNRLIELVGSQEPLVTPSIYLLVYDAYVNNATMLGYGIDNLAQEQYLKELDFKLYPKTYSLGSQSLPSIGRVLNASTSYYGDKRRATSGDGVVQYLLGGFGYRTYGIFSWDFFSRGRAPSYDVSVPDASSSAGLLIKAIVLGELRFDLDFREIPQAEYAQIKQDIFSESPDQPRFIYTHSLLPKHSQMSGVCRPNEIELYAERLAAANLEMKRDVELILENDPGAIVIVAGDHGPQLTKNCLQSTMDEYDLSEITRHDVQDRFGTFLAIKWPTADFEEYDEITILQDLFPVIFAYIFEDEGLLEAKIAPRTLGPTALSGIEISDGIIIGGVNDGEALFP